MAFSFARFLFIALGGVIPLLSYFLESRVPRRVEEIIRKVPPGPVGADPIDVKAQA